MATSDVHMNVTGFDYYADRPDPRIGFTRTAHLIRQARQEVVEHEALTLLFDNGDSLQGTPFGDWAAECALDDHPMAQAFNKLSYDAVGLGNHDFSFGLNLLDRIADQIDCPVICSNLRRVGPTPPLVQSAILQRQVQYDGTAQPIRIGVLSVLPPQTAQWEAHRLDGQAEVEDILTSARHMVGQLQQQDCDIVVALAHSGLVEAQAVENLENATIPLAALDGIDVLVAGHTHLTLPGDAHAGMTHVDHIRGRVHGKPTVMPGFAGSHLGVIDLTLEVSDGGWHIVDSYASLRSVWPEGSADPVPEAPDMADLFANGHARTRKRAAQPVGRVDAPLHSYFSFCAPDRGLALLAAAQAAALRPLLAGTEWGALPMISATAPAKFGGRAGPGYYTDVPAGEISMRHVADLHVFPNELRAVVATGAQIRDWLEMSAGLYNQVTGDQGTPLTDPQRAGHNFDILHGLSYQIDLSQPARFDVGGGFTGPANARIRNLASDSRPVTDTQNFLVALNNYRASGGGHFTMVAEAQQITLPSLRIRDILRDYLAGKLPRDPLEQAAPPFSLAPLGGATAVLETGPGAKAHLHELASYDPHILGKNEAGFLRIALTL
ncbi:MAG: bifunctional 2',3'-cyclic-nucleotide 2'-phosphodiesterase/3'-nucleotidase [Ruegeria sp.]|nr:bifunctional 2',3'-cyclic-nucleotide 2'-phosphodiesterase/3'-nucleotidase [Ruegeria sp.]